jgi:hypothetical protein
VTLVLGTFVGDLGYENEDIKYTIELYDYRVLEAGRNPEAEVLKYNFSLLSFLKEHSLLCPRQMSFSM